MQGARFSLAALVAVTASGCMRQGPDGASGRGLFAGTLCDTILVKERWF